MREAIYAVSDRIPEKVGGSHAGNGRGGKDQRGATIARVMRLRGLRRHDAAPATLLLGASGVRRAIESSV
jgi:hypothetical protein